MVRKDEITPALTKVMIVESPSAPDQPPLVVVAAGKPNWAGKTIVVAEDEDENAFFINTILKSTGVSVLRAYNGEEVLYLCKENPGVSLVLMDIRMPQMDGLTTTRHLRSSMNELPVVATTAYAFSSDRQKCKEAGCNEYLAKPFRNDQLIEMLKKYLS